MDDFQSGWHRRLEQDVRAVLILDDDPTGTQTASDVEVILDASPEAFARFFAGGDRAAYVLTNSRALSREQAVALVRRIDAEIRRAAHAAGRGVALILRGDSTLRGHVFAELDAIAAGDAVILFVPAFPEGGRVTVDGVHYLIVDGERRPVNETEFARDTVFGYHSRTLVDWVAEVGGGRPAVTIPLREVRAGGLQVVATALRHAPPGTVVIPDAETRADLERIAWGLLDAERAGCQVAVRCGATFATIRAGLEPATPLPILPAPNWRVLVACGSHTEASSRQVARLIERTGPPIVINTDLALKGPWAVLDRYMDDGRQRLAEKHTLVVATERMRREAHGDLETGARVMAALTALVAALSSSCDAMVAKGGITSAEVARQGLDAASARVLGQLEPGVALWEVSTRDWRTIPYAVVPGNVGDEGTLVRVATAVGATLAPWPDR